MSDSATNEYLNRVLPDIVELMPNLLEAAGSVENAKTLLASVEHDFVEWQGKKISLDIYRADKDKPTLIFFTGIANYARFYYLFLALLSKKGFNVVAVDRPGHGFSEGQRGDCSVEDMRDLMPVIIDWIKENFNDRIGLFGSSLGGITTFYLLPEITGIKSAICHNWLYPGESADKSKWLLNIILKTLNIFVPKKTIPIRKLIDEQKVLELSESQYLIDYYMDIGKDPLYCQGLTLRSIVSYFGGYKPENPYSKVDIPVLGIIPELEKVLPFETSMAWWKMAGLKEDNIKIIPNAKHMIFHDKPLESLEIVSDWFNKTL